MSIARPRHPTATPPPLWTLLMGVFGIEQALGRQWWTALASATWSESRAWRHELLLTPHLGDPRALPDTVLAPRRVFRVIELLTQERQLLSRRAASCIEEQLLACMDRNCART
jgi:hypothetical protein